MQRSIELKSPLSIQPNPTSRNYIFQGKGKAQKIYLCVSHGYQLVFWKKQTTDLSGKYFSIAGPINRKRKSRNTRRNMASRNRFLLIKNKISLLTRLAKTFSIDIHLPGSFFMFFFFLFLEFPGENPTFSR